MTRPARRTLVWSLYAIGLAQLVLLAGAVTGVGYLIRGNAPDEPHGGSPPMHEHPGEPPPGPPPDGPPHHHGGPGFAPLLTFFLSGVVIVGVGAFWTARGILGPVERLSQTARALGAGDLGARSGLVRDDEIGDLGRAVDEMAGRIQELLFAEKELLANVSHELRTPLARIRVALDMAVDGNPAQARDALGEIAVDLAEIDALIEDIFTATRLSAPDARSGPARLELRVEALAPGALVARAADRFRSRHPSRPLEVHVDEGLPPLSVDPMLARRAIDNLLENAHKYSPDPRSTVALRVRREGVSGVVVEVVDHGMGIPAADLPHLFTPFFRGERSRSRGTGGVGLGLTLTRRIAEAHGGRIELESVPGSGTTARLVLPAGVDARA